MLRWSLAAAATAVACRVDGAAALSLTSGGLTLSFTPAGQLASIATRSHNSGSAGTTWLAAGPSAGGTIVGGAAFASPPAVTSNTKSVCVKRNTGNLTVQDCFTPSTDATNTIQWTSTIESSAAALWSAPIQRGLDLQR